MVQLFRADVISAAARTLKEVPGVPVKPNRKAPFVSFVGLRKKIDAVPETEMMREGLGMPFTKTVASA